jgi:hypothetical protein
MSERPFVGLTKRESRVSEEKGRRDTPPYNNR